VVEVVVSIISVGAVVTVWVAIEAAFAKSIFLFLFVLIDVLLKKKP